MDFLVEGKVGRPRKISFQLTKDILSSFKTKMSDDDGRRLAAPNNPIWTTICDSFKGCKKNGLSIYSYVSCDQDGIRSFLWPEYKKRAKKIRNIDRSDLEQLLNNSTLDETSENDDKTLKYDLYVPKAEFDLLLDEIPSNSTQSCKKKRRKTITPVWNFKKDAWETFINKKLKNCTRILCHFSFTIHWVQDSKASAHFVGACHCNTEIECVGEAEDEIMKFACKIKEKDGPRCGRRSATAKIGDLETERGDDVSESETDSSRPEPNEYQEDETTCDNDPLQDLCLLESTKMKKEILIIRNDPLYVNYCSRHQMTMYRALEYDKNLHLSIGSITSMIKPIKKANDSLSGSPTIYLAATQTPVQIITLGQMITESADSLTIQFWFLDWMEELGLSAPAGIITDGTRNLTEGCIRAFTEYRTVEDYADSFLLHDKIPQVKIRIDDEAYLRSYNGILKELGTETRNIYGSLLKILVSECSSFSEAECSVERILLISRSKHSGLTEDGSLSACAEAEAEIEEMSLSESLKEINLNFMTQDDVFYDDMMTRKLLIPLNTSQESSVLLKWGKERERNVQRKIASQPGCSKNYFYCPNLAAKILNDIKWLPLWSKIGRDHVESSWDAAKVELKNIQSTVLKGLSVPVTCDTFIERHKLYIDGRKETEILEDENIDEAFGRCHEEDDDSKFTEPFMENDRAETTRDESNSRGDPMLDTTDHPNSNKNADSTNNDDSVSDNFCAKCRNGVKKYLKCAICQNLVHKEKECSVVIFHDSEKPERGRLCINCSKKKDRMKLCDALCSENWGNEVERHKKKQNSNKVNVEVIQAPIVVDLPTKNKLRFVRIRDKTVEITRACAFDAMLQLFLVAASTSDNFGISVIKNVNHNSFFELVQHGRDEGVTDDTVIKRYDILSRHFQEKQLSNGVVLDCFSTVAEMTDKICSSVPCFESLLNCTNNCPHLADSASYYSIPLGEWFNGRTEDHLKNSGSSQCSWHNCSGEMMRSIYPVENFIILEITSAFTTSDHVKLSLLPPTIEISTTPKIFELRGAIHYQLPRKTRIRSNGFDPHEEPIGHYSTYCKNGDSWLHYGDVVAPCRSSQKILPVIVLYTT